MSVEQYRGRPQPDPIGVLGDTSDGAHFDDLVRVRAELSEPAYCCLMVLKTNGDSLVYIPHADPVSQASKVKVLTYPDPAKFADGKTGYYALNDSENGGAHAFVLLASRQPFRDESQWRSTLAGIPWKLGHLSGVWQFDGSKLQHPIASRGVESAPESELDVFERTCQTLKKLPGVDAMQAVAFSVLPKPPQQKTKP
jgi:hypothetical protein